MTSSFLKCVFSLRLYETSKLSKREQYLFIFMLKSIWGRKIYWMQLAATKLRTRTKHAKKKEILNFYPTWSLRTFLNSLYRNFRK